MESQQQKEFSSEIPLPQDDEWLLRLNFSPEHINNGKIIPAAISLKDLKERGFSVDRERLVNPSTLAERVQSQSGKKPQDRIDPYISRFQCGAVRLIEDEGKPAFKVEASPSKDNHAHAHIMSSQALGESGLRKLRNLLLPELQKNLIALDEYMR
jgi:hypothetical protein